jgi:hypothetical protein
MEKGRAAAQVSQDKKGFFDGLGFVCGKENVIQEEEKPMHHSPEGPDKIEKEQEFEPFGSKLRGRVFVGEKRTVECPPEEAKVITHLS